MADFSKLTSWAVENTARFDISVTKLSWINEWLPGFFDYRVKLRIGGNDFFGRGIDAKESTAFDKAVAEALERAAVSDMPAPWATAAYPDYPGAAERAYRELVCIDRVLSHHFCGVPFKPLELKILAGAITTKKLARVLLENGLHLELCELRSVTDASIVAAFVWSERGHRVKGLVSGFGCEKNIEDASLHALIECLRTAAAVFCGNITPEPWETRRVAGNPQWHFWMAQKQEAKDFLTGKLLSPRAACGSSWKAEKISFKDVTINEISSLEPLIPDLPVRLVQASSEVMLLPQFGDIVVDERLTQRLEKFAGFKVAPEIIVPHFYD